MIGAPTSYGAFVDAYLAGDLRDDAATSSAVVCLAAPGTPVVYVSPAFEAHTGYPFREVVGRSLSILQGPGTETEAVGLFRRLIDARASGTIRITNYRRDGTAFLHRCELRPIATRDGEVTHFIAIQRPCA